MLDPSQYTGTCPFSLEFRRCVKHSLTAQPVALYREDCQEIKCKSNGILNLSREIRLNCPFQSSNLDRGRVLNFHLVRSQLSYKAMKHNQT